MAKLRRPAVAGRFAYWDEQVRTFQGGGSRWAARPVPCWSFQLPARWHGLAFTLAGSDTPDEVLAYLDEIVEKGVLSPEERARSEAFYRRLFPQDAMHTHGE